MPNVKPRFTNNAPAQSAQATPPTVVSYEVDGQRIQLSDMDVANMILDPKTAGLVSQQEIVYFLQMCKAQKLNPFVRDAYLIKYDASAPAQIVTSCASLEKRAEDFAEYAGMKSGVITYNRETGEITERKGTLVIKAIEDLIGGWAKVYRKDRQEPITATVNFDEYNTGKSIWKAKPGVMIRKCAKAMALREAFPKHNANLYDSDEVRTGTEDSTATAIQQPAPMQQVAYTENPQTGEIVDENPFA